VVGASRSCAGSWEGRPSGWAGGTAPRGVGGRDPAGIAAEPAVGSSSLEGAAGPRGQFRVALVRGSGRVCWVPVWGMPLSQTLGPAHHGRRGPGEGGGVCPGWVGSEQGPALAPPAPALMAGPGLIWHLPEGQPEALSPLSGLSSRTGVLCPCSGRSCGAPAVGIRWSPLCGPPAGHQVCCRARARGGCTARPSPVPWPRELCRPRCDGAGAAVAPGGPAAGCWGRLGAGRWPGPAVPPTTAQGQNLPRSCGRLRAGSAAVPAAEPAVLPRAGSPCRGPAAGARPRRLPQGAAASLPGLELAAGADLRPGDLGESPWPACPALAPSLLEPLSGLESRWEEPLPASGCCGRRGSVPCPAGRGCRQSRSVVCVHTRAGSAQRRAECPVLRSPLCLGVLGMWPSIPHCPALKKYYVCLVTVVERRRVGTQLHLPCTTHFPILR